MNSQADAASQQIKGWVSGQNPTLRYATLGFLMGLVFPLFSTLIESWNRFSVISFDYILRVQSETPLLWVIDLAPVVLGLFAAFMGIKQKKIAGIISTLRQTIKTQTGELVQANRRLADILQSMGDLVIILDKKGWIKEVNIAVVKSFGLEETDLIDQPVSILFGVEDHKRISSNSPVDMFDFGFQKHIEGTYQTRYGHSICLETTVTNILNSLGKVEGVVCVSHDISDRKKREEMLEKSRKAYESLFEASPIPIIVDQDNGIVFHNREIENTLGFSADQIQSKTLEEFIHPDDRETALNGHSKVESGVQNNGKPVFRIITPDGETRWLEVRSTSMTWNDRPALLSFIIDITDRHKMELEIQESEKQYRGLVQSINTIVMKVDNQFRFTFLNKFGQEFFGYSEEEVLGLSVLDTITPKRDAKGNDLRSMTRKILENPAEFTENENENIRSNGERIWVAWRNRPVFDEQNNLLEILSTGYDITERVNAENIVKQKTAQLEDSIKELNCLYGMSKLTELHGKSPQTFLQETIELIRSSLQYPELAGVKLLLKGEEYFTFGFQNSLVKISEVIYKNQTHVGTLEVHYRYDESKRSIVGFLTRETKLLQVIADRIGRALEHFALEDALKESETRYKLVFNSAPIPLLVTQDEKFCFANKQAEALFGYSREDLFSRPFIEFVYEEDRKIVFDRYQKRIRGKEAIPNYSYRILNRLGEVRWVEIISIPLAWNNRPATLSFQMDITDRLESEKKIREQNQILEQVHSQMTDELEQARLAQLTLLPAKIPKLQNIRVARRYEPITHIGGDFYDLFNEKDRLGILVGDVTGHGIPAALLSFLFLTTFKNHQQNGSKPDEIINRTNTMLAGNLPQGKYASMFYCSYHQSERILRFSSAGHPPAILLRPNTGELIYLKTGGMVVGMFKDPMLPFETREIELQPGDKVLIYTDGIIEISDKQNKMQEPEIFEEFLSTQMQIPIEKLLDKIYRYCLSVTGFEGFDDDITMIGLEIF